MAYLDLRGTQYTLPNESMITDTDTVLDGKYRVEYIEDLWTSVPSKFYLGINTNGQVVLSLGSEDNAWDIANRAISTATLAPSSTY